MTISGLPWQQRKEHTTNILLHSESFFVCDKLSSIHLTTFPTTRPLQQRGLPRRPLPVSFLSVNMTGWKKLVNLPSFAEFLVVIDSRVICPMCIYKHGTILCFNATKIFSNARIHYKLLRIKQRRAINPRLNSVFFSVFQHKSINPYTLNTNDVCTYEYFN